LAKNDILTTDKHCEIEGCINKRLHTTRAHHCRKCRQNHSIKECPLLVGISASDTKHILIKCPLCNTQNDIDRMQKKVYGSKDECCVCLTNNVEVYFPKCGHVCVCLKCCDRMDTNKTVNSVDDIVCNESGLPQHTITKVKKILKGKGGKVYNIAYAGMGCSWYIRRDFMDGSLLALFLHSDCQGQYGIDHFPLVEKFISGYNKI